MRNLQVGVKLGADAVADELAHDAKIVLAGMAFDRPSDVVHLGTRSHRVDALHHRHVRLRDEFAGMSIDVADKERARIVAVHTVDDTR